ncbi:hypothetical protein [Streptococcus phage P738]|nr:hypothetical protein [Streptococcus phage P738]
MIRRMIRNNEDNNNAEVFYDHYLSGNKVRIDIEGQNNDNNFYVICNGSAGYYVQLFKEGFENNTPIFLTSAETGSKLIINPRAVFNVGITEIKKEK